MMTRSLPMGQLREDKPFLNGFRMLKSWKCSQNLKKKNMFPLQQGPFAYFHLEYVCTVAAWLVSWLFLIFSIYIPQKSLTY